MHFQGYMLHLIFALSPLEPILLKIGMLALGSVVHSRYGYNIPSLVPSFAYPL
jgi:hypothetical protein